MKPFHVSADRFFHEAPHIRYSVRSPIRLSAVDSIIWKQHLHSGKHLSDVPPERLDSRNYLDAFFGKEQTARKDVVLEAQGRMAYRSGDWIMMPPYKGSERNLTGNELGNLGEYGLFNVKADRTQQQNMAAQQPELLDSLKQNFFAEVDGYYRSEVEEEPLK